MTESEAIELLRHEVGDSMGFVAQVENAGLIPAERVTSFLEALDMLAGVWKARPEVPKYALLPLVDLPSRIYAAALVHEDSYDQIEELSIEVYTHISNAFGNPPDPTTEEGARRIIEEQFSSTAGLPYTLRMRLGYSSEVLAEALTALQTLAGAWRDRETIPRALAGVMFDIRDAVRGTAGLYPDRQTEIEVIADALGAAVIKCLT